MYVKRLVLTAMVASIVIFAGAQTAGTSEAKVRTVDSHHMPLTKGMKAAAEGSASRSASAQNEGSQQAATGAIHKSSDLTLPYSAFPDGFALQESLPETAADADTNIISGLHSVSYKNLGMVGGWWQYFSKSLPEGTFDVVYLGSYYSNPDSASSAFQDVGANLSFAGPTSLCSMGDQCLQTTVTITFPDGQYQGVYRVVQKSNAIAEMVVDLPSARWADLQGTAKSYLDTEANAYLGLFSPAVSTPTNTPIPTNTPVLTNTPTSTPTPTATTPKPVAVDFSIIGARAEKNKAKADTNLTKSPVTQVKVGTKVYLSIYVLVRSAPAGASMTSEFMVSRNGRVEVNRTVERESGAFPTDTFRVFTTFKPTKKGKHVFKAVVTINGVSQAATASIKAIK